MTTVKTADPEMALNMGQHCGEAGDKVGRVEIERMPLMEAHGTKTTGMDIDRVDKEMSHYVSDIRLHISPEKNKELRQKIDKGMLLIMVLTYLLQAIDKGTLSFVSIMVIIDDTHLVGQDYSWLTTCIYITIPIVEYPQNWIIARVPIVKYISFNITAWGAVLSCTAACQNFTGLVVVRTMLGLFESACQPAFVILSSIWYKHEEQASRVTSWYMMNEA